jgi:mannan endo-1,4-beta-mannosidase
MQRAIDWSKKTGGLITFCWHWRNPLSTAKDMSGQDIGFYTDKAKDNVHVDLNQLSNKNSNVYKAITRNIDHVAKYLRQAQEAKVPILFRPLHEAQGK